MQLIPTESATNDPKVGGFIAKFESGVMKSITWRTGAPIEPTVDAAKKYAVTLVDDLLKHGHHAEVRDTNWTSAVAGIQKIIGDWNAALRQSLYATPSKH